MMKKSAIIPSVLFATVFCVSLICQRYTLIFREDTGLFLLTPDWLREVFSHPWALSNFTGSFLGQFYAEPVAGPMIPAAIITVIYLCLNSFLKRCRVPFHRLFAVAMALTAWYFTANMSKLSAIAAVMLISLALDLLSRPVLQLFKACEARPDNPGWWQIVAALVLVAGTAALIGIRKDIRDNEEMANVVVNAGEGNWDKVLRTATPEKVMEQPLMMPFALLALNGQVRLSESMFRYPVSGPASLDLSNEKNAIGNLFQAFLFETLGVPNEAIHQFFQFSTNFDHGMTHLSMRSLIRCNINAEQYGMAAKYAAILSHNPYYSHQARRIFKKYRNLAPAGDSTEVSSSTAPAFTHDAAYDMMQLYKGGNTSPAVMDRLLALLLLERNLDDFLTIFYSYDWSGKAIPSHYQEALLISGDIREDVYISQEISRRYSTFLANASAPGTYWEYYFREENKVN